MRHKKNQTPLNPKQKKQVDAMINSEQETKAIRYNQITTYLSSGLAFANLTPIFAGTGSDQRVGNQVDLIDIRYKYECHMGSAAFIANDEYNACRIIIFRWYLPDSIPPVIADILLSTGGGFPTHQPINYVSIDNKKIHIISDKTFLLTSDTIYNPGKLPFAGMEPVNGQGSTRIGGGYLKRSRLGRKHITYNSGSTTGVGTVYAFFISDSSVAPDPGGNFSSLVRYKDS